MFFWLQLCNGDLFYHHEYENCTDSYIYSRRHELIFHYFDLLPSIITCLNPFVYNRLELCTSYIEIKELTMAIINSIYTSTVLTGIRIEYHLIFWCFG